MCIRDRSKSTDSSVNSQSSLPYSIAHYTDFLVYDATYPGYFAFRNETNGSWFIQALCEEIEHAEPGEELMSILTKVTRCVVEKQSNSDNPNFNGKKQVPLRQETLIRKIYLKNSIKCGNSYQNESSAITDISLDQEFSKSSNVSKKSCMLC